MFIRGIDFARHNVIVGNEAEHPVPQSQLRTPQQGGELVARVLSAAGSEATLDIIGQRVVVQTHVALNIGDKLFVKVSEGANNALRLSILASEPENGNPLVADSELDTLLRELGLPVDEKTRNAARALLARDGTIDKPAMQTLLADMRKLPGATAKEAGAAALLGKANVPVNPATVAVVTNRLDPQAPPQLAARLAPLKGALEGLKRQLPVTSATQSVVSDLLDLLSGIPLDEKATPEKVEQGLKKWLQALDPKEARAARAELKAAPEASEQDAPLHKSLGTAEPALPAAGRTAVADALKNLGRLATPEMQSQVSEETPAKDPRLGTRDSGPATPSQEGPQAPKQGMERADRVPPSQHFVNRMGISTKVPEPGKADLASMLERLTQALGPEHKGLKELVREAAAEVRYTQLVNNASPATQAERNEFLVPLLVPQLSPDQPEGRIQVFHRQAKKGDPIDPDNVRLVFVLNTDHLGTVQADVAIKDGIIDLTVGVPDTEDRNFLSEHVAELEGAIAKLGWDTGRFGTRLAKGPPPKVRQEEGLQEVVRFDRRV
jgi:hypothetical protein